MKYRQGKFKEGDTLVVIDPVMDNSWEVLTVDKIYEHYNGFDTTLIYEDGDKCKVEAYLFNIGFADEYLDIYKIVKEF